MRHFVPKVGNGLNISSAFYSFLFSYRGLDELLGVLLLRAFNSHGLVKLPVRILSPLSFDNISKKIASNKKKTDALC